MVYRTSAKYWFHVPDVPGLFGARAVGTSSILSVATVVFGRVQRSTVNKVQYHTAAWQAAADTTDVLQCTSGEFVCTLACLWFLIS